MRIGKAAALTAGLVGAIAVGVAVGPTVHDRWMSDRAPASTETAPVATEAPAADMSPAKATGRRARRAAPEPKRETREFASASTTAAADNTLVRVGVGVWPSELRDRAKNVLNRGTKLELAAEDFTTSEDFMTVAHAARNTEVPFVVLKHRVLEEGRTLADAIHEFKPELNAKAEAERARAAAREDLNAIG